jgi:hypothetical protein
MKINKTEAIAYAMMIFGAGGVTGNMVSDNQYVSLRVTMIQEMEGFIVDMKEDINNGRIDSIPASYYLHNWEIIHDELTYTPDEYTEWYE